MIKAG